MKIDTLDLELVLNLPAIRNENIRNMLAMEMIEKEKNYGHIISLTIEHLCGSDEKTILTNAVRNEMYDIFLAQAGKTATDVSRKITQLLAMNFAATEILSRRFVKALLTRLNNSLETVNQRREIQREREEEVQSDSLILEAIRTTQNIIKETKIAAEFSTIRLRLPGLLGPCRTLACSMIDEFKLISVLIASVVDKITSKEKTPTYSLSALIAISAIILSSVAISVAAESSSESKRLNKLLLNISNFAKETSLLAYVIKAKAENLRESHTVVQQELLSLEPAEVSTLLLTASHAAEAASEACKLVSLNDTPFLLTAIVIAFASGAATNALSVIISVLSPQILMKFKSAHVAYEAANNLLVKLQSVNIGLSHLIPFINKATAQLALLANENFEDVVPENRFLMTTSEVADLFSKVTILATSETDNDILIQHQLEINAKVKQEVKMSHVQYEQDILADNLMFLTNLMGHSILANADAHGWVYTEMFPQFWRLLIILDCDSVLHNLKMLVHESRVNIEKQIIGTILGTIKLLYILTTAPATVKDFQYMSEYLNNLKSIVTESVVDTVIVNALNRENTILRTRSIEFLECIAKLRVYMLVNYIVKTQIIHETNGILAVGKLQYRLLSAMMCKFVRTSYLRLRELL